MGAERFDQYQNGTDAELAFRTAKEAAFYEYGHGGYSGTLAEKPGFDLRPCGGPLTIKEAEAFADQDLEQNDHDKWGNAWAVPIKDEASGSHVGFWFYGYASS